MFKKILVILSLVLVWSFSLADDALDDVLWSNSDAAAYQIINNKSDVEWLVVTKHWILWAKDKQSFIITLAQFLLKVTVILWVIVFMVWWIRFLMSFWDDSKAKKVRDNLIIAMLWFVVAFWAWVILQLVMSIWITLNVK